MIEGLKATTARLKISQFTHFLTLNNAFENFWKWKIVILTMLLTIDFDEILIEGRSYYDLYNSEEIIALALSLPELWLSKNFTCNTL